jgi:hypothetical protein
MATRSKNKTVRPGKEAGLERKTRSEIQAKKAAKDAAQEEARAAKDRKQALAITMVASMEREQEANYALTETPRAAPFSQRRPSRSTAGNSTPRKKAPPAPRDSSPPSPSSDGQSDKFIPEDETDETSTEEGGATENTTDAEQPKRKRKKGKVRKEKRAIRKAISQAKEQLIEDLVTPRPKKRTQKPAELSVSIHF